MPRFRPPFFAAASLNVEVCVIAGTGSFCFRVFMCLSKHATTCTLVVAVGIIDWRLTDELRVLT